MEYPQHMDIRFQKMHGTLNDFVVFRDLEGVVTLSPNQVAHICDRRAGVGGDGVIVVRSSDSADFFMDYVNADGSPAEMCGNGIRCLAKYVYDSGLTAKTTLSVETRAGAKVVELLPGSDGKIMGVRVDMGKPVFDPHLIPVNLDNNGKPIIDHAIEAQERTFHASILSMGNPHCVIFVEAPPDALPERYGPAIENHPLFPAKTNVEFIQVLDRNRLLMRVWERGSGETFSCGTGACAAAVAACVKGLVDYRTVVQLRGGDLEIEWKGITSSVVMTGDANLAYSGVITI